MCVSTVNIGIIYVCRYVHTVKSNNLLGLSSFVNFVEEKIYNFLYVSLLSSNTDDAQVKVERENNCEE